MPDLDRNTGMSDPLESASSDKRRAYQNNFLKEIVAHSYSSSTPLKAAMDARGITPRDITTLEDLSKLPITKKKDLSDHQKATPPFGGYVTVPISHLLRIHQSPGPIYDPVGKEHDYWRWKVALYAAGFRPGDLVINTFAYHLTPAGHMFEEGVSELGGVIIPTGVGNTETQAEILRDLNITGYIGTPSFLMAILNKAREMGVEIPGACKLEVAFLLAEMLPESMRKRFSDEFGITARQTYGTADVGCISYECPEINGMHIHYDRIVEIVNPETGEVLPDGEPGEVVVTCNNRTYPLVRFGTGDLSSMVNESCVCGRTGPKLTRIMGRVDQVTKIKGMFVHPSQVQRVLDSYPEIVKGRLLVERPGDQDRMTLEIEVKGETSEEFLASVERTLRETVKLRGAVRVLASGALPPEHKTIDDVRKWD